MASKDLQAVLLEMKRYAYRIKPKGRKNSLSYSDRYRKKLDKEITGLLISPKDIEIGLKGALEFDIKGIKAKGRSAALKRSPEDLKLISSLIVKFFTKQSNCLIIVNSLESSFTEIEEYFINTKRGFIYIPSEELFLFRSFSSLEYYTDLLKAAYKNHRKNIVKFFFGTLNIGHTYGPGAGITLSSLSDSMSGEYNSSLFNLEKGRPLRGYSKEGKLRGALKLNPALDEALSQVGGKRESELRSILKNIKTITVRGIKLELQLELERRIIKGDLNSRIVCTVYQPEEVNTASGAPLAQINKQIADLIKEFFKKAKTDPNLLSGSKSGIDLWNEQITSAFYDKPIKNVKSKTKVKDKLEISKKRNVKVRVNTLKSAKYKVKGKTTKTISQIRILSTLNARMHDQIQKNMGKGNSKEILNYRTGRFAKSVEIENLILSKSEKTAEARVKYMQYPYGVFEPGGRLHKPGRDPHGIIGRSIRQILQQEKLYTLARVGVQLHG